MAKALFLVISAQMIGFIFILLILCFKFLRDFQFK